MVTYGQIAKLVPLVEGVDLGTYLRLAPRWVGSAMATCPDEVPWQRVINGQGKISPRPGMGVLVQRKLLEDEGVAFDEKERIDLARFGWEPNPAWLTAHGYAVLDIDLSLNRWRGRTVQDLLRFLRVSLLGIGCTSR